MASEIDVAVARVQARFPRSRFRVTVVEEWTPRGKRRKKSFATIAVFNNVEESAATLGECVELICEWRERDPD